MLIYFRPHYYIVPLKKHFYFYTQLTGRRGWGWGWWWWWGPAPVVSLQDQRRAECCMCCRAVGHVGQPCLCKVPRSEGQELQGVISWIWFLCGHAFRVCCCCCCCCCGSDTLFLASDIKAHLLRWQRPQRAAAALTGSDWTSFVRPLPLWVIMMDTVRDRDWPGLTGTGRGEWPGRCLFCFVFFFNVCLYRSPQKVK